MSAENYSVSKMVGVLTASIATIGVNSLGLGPIAAAIAADFATGVNTVMVAAGSYGLCTAASALFLSRLVDRYGVKRALNVSLMGLALAFGLSGLAPNAVFLILAQGFAGLAAGVALPAIYAFTASISPKGRESAVLGRVLFGWTISMVAGVSISTAIADFADWRLVFALLAIIALGASALVARVPAPARSGGVTEAAGATSPLAALRIEGVAPLLLVCLALMTAFYGVYGYVGDHINKHLALPVSAAGVLAVTYGAGFGIAMFADHHIDRIGVRRAFPWCFAAIAGVYLGLGFSVDIYWGLVALSFLWGFGNHLGLNLLVAGLSAIDPARRGSILGLYSAVTYLAASMGAVGYGIIYAGSGFQPLAFISAAMLAAAAIYLAQLYGPRRQIGVDAR